MPRRPTRSRPDPSAARRPDRPQLQPSGGDVGAAAGHRGANGQPGQAADQGAGATNTGDRRSAGRGTGRSARGRRWWPPAWPAAAPRSSAPGREGEVVPARTVQVELVRSLHHLRIPADATDQGHDHLPLRDQLSADLDIGVGDSGGALHRWVEPQCLLHRRIDQGRDPRRPAARAPAVRSRASTVLPIRFTVVSKPAISSRVHSGTMSSARICSPGAVARRLITSSPGSTRRSLDQVGEDPLQPPLRVDTAPGHGGATAAHRAHCRTPGRIARTPRCRRRGRPAAG